VATNTRAATTGQTAPVGPSSLQEQRRGRTARPPTAIGATVSLTAGMATLVASSVRARNESAPPPSARDGQATGQGLAALADQHGLAMLTPTPVLPVIDRSNVHLVC
jgi:hypothetical protein